MRKTPYSFITESLELRKPFMEAVLTPSQMVFSILKMTWRLETFNADVTMASLTIQLSDQITAGHSLQQRQLRCKRANCLTYCLPSSASGAATATALKQ